MKQLRCRPWRVVTWVAMGLVLGCGRGGPPRPKTYPVSGTVTYKGAPLAGATIAFIGAGGKQAAIGETDAAGRYKLTTFQKDDGAVPGEYRVKAEKYERAAGPAPTSSGEQKGPADDPNYAGAKETPEGAEIPGPKNLLPAKYANPDTSRLRATVKESGQNQFDFTLE